uniref:Transmembrane protein n=1 Tax=Romanomermis culicivorax TaxID=13658 RepID=A0A915L788_ROMCU
MQILEHHLKNRPPTLPDDELANRTTTTVIRALDRTIGRTAKVSFGWSMVAAIFAACLSAVASQFFIVGSRTVKKRRKSQYRRRRMEAAMVSPCEQEVALAMRAQMIVI